jgi:hypothetical protein
MFVKPSGNLFNVLTYYRQGYLDNGARGVREHDASFRDDRPYPALNRFGGANVAAGPPPEKGLLDVANPEWHTLFHA